MRRWLRSALPWLALISIIALLVVQTNPADARRLAAQGDEAEATPIGVPRLGETAWEVIGRSDRGNQDVQFVGYLTYVAGAEDGLVFTRPDRPTEETARFTFVATLTPGALSQIEAVDVQTATGTLTIYFQAEGGADFTDPATFGDGTPIATFDLRTQDILYGRSASSILAIAAGDLTQTSAEPFEDGADTYRLGRANTRLHLGLTGVEAREAAGPNRSIFILAGHAELTGASGPAATGQEGTESTPTEEPAEEPETTEEATEESEEPAGDDDCAAIAPWFESTSAQAADIDVLGDFIIGIEQTSDLDAGQLNAAADALQILADQQRATQLPDEAAEISGRIADAMEAIGVAVRDTANAVEEADEDALDAAQEDLTTALDDLNSAMADAEAIAGPCQDA